MFTVLRTCLMCHRIDLAHDYSSQLVSVFHHARSQFNSPTHLYVPGSQRVPDGTDALNGPLSVADRITRSHNLDTAAVYRLIPALLVHFV